MSSQTLHWAMQQQTGGPVEKLALMMMADGIGTGDLYLADETSLARLAGRMDTNPAGLREALAGLERRGLVRLEGCAVRLIGAP